MKPYYDDGQITVYCGDCRDVLPSLERAAVGCLVMDPPYGIGYATNRVVRGVGASWRGQPIANDDSLALRDTVLAWADGLPALVFGTWKQPTPKGTRGVLVWDKGPASGMGDLSFPWKGSWESVAVLGAGWQGSRDEGVLKGYHVVTWESLGRSHPTEKPVGLIRALLSKAPDGVIVDPCMGTGATLRAAKDLGRRAIGIESEERYCEIAVRRLSQMVLPLDEYPTVPPLSRSSGLVGEGR